jgi:hypothetical protein
MKPFGWKVTRDKTFPHNVVKGYGVMKGIRLDTTWYLWMPGIKIALTRKRKDLR